MMIRINRVFDPLREEAAFERRLDVAASAEPALTRARQAAEDYPRRIALVLQLASLLRDMGRSEEALRLVERIVSSAQGPDGGARFDDLEAHLNWLLFAKADLLYDLGRNTEARTIYSEAVGTSGIGQGNITLTFAGMLNAEGRGADALEVLTLAPRLTTFADVWLQSERACAAHLVGDAAVRDEALARIRPNELDNASAAMHALLCVNDIDGAAALMIRRLGHRAHRELALVALQPFRRLETRRMPMEVLELERLAQVRDRADVRAAVETVGRIEPSPLYSY
jgi:tetratricopeptide (TPR) repeat protein